MTQRKQIESFNHHLDALLHGDKTDSAALPEADQQSLDIARRLAALDLSAQSALRHSLRRKLAQNARLVPSARQGYRRKSLLQPAAALTLALPGATLLFVLVFVLGWTFTSLSRMPASGGPVSATAFALPGVAIQPGLLPDENSPDVQAFAPKPLPTPIAPPQTTTDAPTTFSPDLTPSQTSLRTGSIHPTRVSP
jgi:hypothetical protein